MPDVVSSQMPDEELGPEERDALIDKLARKIVNRRMETPAIMFLEMHKPVTFLAGQSMLVASPLIAPFIGMESVGKYSMLFNSQDNVELLIRRIEDLADERETGGGGI